VTTALSTTCTAEPFELQQVEIEILLQISYTELSLGHGLDWERILCRAHGGDVFEGLDRLLDAKLITKYFVKDCAFYNTTSAGLQALAAAKRNTTGQRL